MTDSGLHEQTKNQATTQSLVIQTAFVGDLLLSIPLFKHLRRLLPNDRLVLVCRQGLGAFLLRTGLVDEVIEVNKSDRASLKRLQQNLKARQFHQVICPHQSFRSIWMSAGLKAKRKTGYTKWWNAWAFDHRVIRPMHLPEALRQLALLDELDPEMNQQLRAFADTSLRGGLRPSSDHSKPALNASHPAASLAQVPEWASMQVEAFTKLRQNPNELSPKVSEVLASFERQSQSQNQNQIQTQTQKRPLAVVAPGSVWPTKMWTSSGYIEAAQRLVKDGYDVAVLGAPNEKEICAKICAAVPGAQNLAGQLSLIESTELLAVSDLLICNDSGAMHMAAVAGTPTVSVFGPTTLELGYRPWQNHAAVAQVEMSCRPCGKHGAKRCPLGTHACMKAVSADEVLSLRQSL